MIILSRFFDLLRNSFFNAFPYFQIDQLKSENEKLAASAKRALNNQQESSSPIDDANKILNISAEFETLKAEKEALEKELEELREKSKVDTSSSSTTTASDVLATLDDESKMVQLLKVKEKYNEVRLTLEITVIGAVDYDAL
jgi:predicted transcriptional regulator